MRVEEGYPNEYPGSEAVPVDLNDHDREAVSRLVETTRAALFVSLARVPVASAVSVPEYARPRGHE